MVPADSFDNVKGKFPIGFFIWRTGEEEAFKSISAEVYDRKGEFIGTKDIHSTDNCSQPISRWLIRNNGSAEETCAGNLNSGRNDFQNQNLVYIANYISGEKSHAAIFRFTQSSFIIGSVFFAVRHCITSDWLNDRDQFLTPCESWRSDKTFRSDCIAYTLFHGSNRISSEEGTNHWIPFTEQEVNAREKFRSHFLSDYIKGKCRTSASTGGLFGTNESHVDGSVPIAFSPEAQDVMDAGRELWKYYHSKPDTNPDASFYDIRLYFQGRKPNGQMNPGSDDKEYTELIAALRERMKILAGKIAPKVYEYRFLL